MKVFKGLLCVASVKSFCYHDRRSFELRIRRFLLILIAVLAVALPLSAADDTVWWDGMVMTDFTYTGLQNVSQKTVNDILRPYIGDEFSDSVFAEMNGVLYAQPWLSYVSAEALRGGESGNDLIIQWTSHQPYLMSVLKKRKCEGGRHLSCSN